MKISTDVKGITCIASYMWQNISFHRNTKNPVIWPFPLEKKKSEAN